MDYKSKIPLGYVELTDGSKAIYPMNDIFLNYLFEAPENWEALRLTANILLDAYIIISPETTVKPIKGSVKVRTQFRHLLSTNTKLTRNQDIKMIETNDDSTYVELQNDVLTDPPIEICSVV